ncbi:MAG: hypothetical protein AVDCRST_MAG73-2568, partial [uncultured Thermomicrobiales bacterium]
DAAGAAAGNDRHAQVRTPVPRPGQTPDPAHRRGRHRRHRVHGGDRGGYRAQPV